MRDEIFNDFNRDEITMLLDFRAIAPEQHDFSLFKVSYIDDLDAIFFIKTPSVPHPMVISMDLAEQIMFDPTIVSSLTFDFKQKIISMP